MSQDPTSSATLDTHESRVRELLSISRNQNNQQVDRFFTWMMVLQYIAGIAATLLISPHTWIGGTSYLHLHVWFAVVFGAILSGVPIYMARTFPGSNVNMHVMAVAQSVWGALLIHFTGGRIETHFHVFCSLAFIAFYRDWRPVITMTVVVACDHALRGVVWPLSVYGVATESPWRWLEHASWIILEDIVLILSCLRGRRESEQVCHKQAELEALNAGFESKVEIRTRDLELARKRSDRLAMVAKHTDNSVLVLDCKGRVEWVNQGFTRQTGYDAHEIIRKHPIDVLGGTESDPKSVAKLTQAQTQGREIDVEIKKYRKDGSVMILEIEGRPILNRLGEVVQYFQIERDITERKKGEQERERLHHQLREAARAAGRADVAASVMHNLGNVLNSVTVSITLLREKLTRSEASQLSKAANILDQHSSDLAAFITNDPRGRHFPRLLRELSDTLAREKSSELNEINSLVSSVDHIRSIVDSQINIADHRHVIESVSLQDAVEAAIEINEIGFSDQRLQLIVEIGTVDQVFADQHELTQMLATIIKNAQEACMSNHFESHRITISARCEDKMAIIDVSDTGVGIKEEDLQVVFQPGFTTKETGTGFGLHAAAITATELGGSLTARSDGVGMGSVFQLRIPMIPGRKTMGDAATINRTTGMESVR